MTREQIINALNLCYQGVPYGWNATERLSEIGNFMSEFERIEGQEVPLSTYLIFTKTQLRLDLTAAFNAVFSAKLKESFRSRLQELKDKARVQVGLDDGNFKAEVAAFGDIAKAVTSPHLEISALYRYMAAVQQSQLEVITDALVAEATAVLRENPYLYFAYGRDFLPLMPIAWEAL